tara:strand:- start:13422 stop:14003 length:582 start_codon:yes stop_codon:yes gene_type:complete
MHKGGLKKEFNKSDVQRIRNIVNKDFTSKTKFQSGYKKSQGFHEEGDVWEENGKKWTIKNGIKQNVTKLDEVKKSIRTPLCCPKCGGSMSYYLSKQIYKIHKMCMNCFLDYEDVLKKNGLLKKNILNQRKANLKFFIRELEQSLTLVSNDTNVNDFVTEAGDVEDWKVNKSSVNKKEIEKITEYLEHLKSMLD